MKIRTLFFLLFLLFLFDNSYSQGFIITQPRVEIEETNLIILYNIITKHSNDQFYVWVEIKKSNGEKIQAMALTGDVGENIKAGNDKKIIWSPENDSIYLDEEIIVEVKAEKYNKAFNKGSMMLKSAVLPGWGQSIISKGKPYWLTGIAVYGTLAGGLIYHKKYLASFESYKIEEDPEKRADLYDQTQKQSNISTILVYSAATAWALNILWVALIPNTYQPLQHAKISLLPTQNIYNNKGLLLSFNLEF